jgi:glutamate dehydrogenase (NAD(P)+)
MTGLGVAFAARRAVGGDLAGKRVAIQGFGLVGAGSAIRLEALGARVVAISDASGAVHDPAGLDIGRLYAASHGARVLPKGVATEPRDAVFEAEADVLVLAASSHSVSEHLAQGIAAPLVVEGSNFGLTEVARAVLQDRGVAVIPDLIASSSSAAMVARQMAARGRLGADELWSSIETAIDEATGIAMAAARESGTDVRTGYLAAFPCH